ncbi:MAG: DNA translocase FtsK [Candidatus Zixiibacteriota bacterium]
MKWFSKISYKRRSELFGFLLVLVVLFAMLSLATRTEGDDRWLAAEQDAIWIETYYPRNLAGILGAVVAYSLYELLGFSAWGLLASLGAFGIKRFFLAKKSRIPWSVAGVSLGVFIVGVMTDLRDAYDGVAWTAGIETISGQLGRSLASFVAEIMGVAGGTLVLGGILAIALYWVIPWKPLLALVPDRKKKPEPPVKRRQDSPGWSPVGALTARVQAGWAWMTGLLDSWSREEAITEPPTDDPWVRVEPEPKRTEILNDLPALPPELDSPGEEDEERDEPESVRERPRERHVLRLQRSASDGDYEFPALDLLEPARGHTRRRADVQTADTLLRTLKTFDIGVDGGIQTFPGPVITRYEFRPAPGVKVNQIVNLADDLALALSASRVRVVAPVPGKSAVGIEVPNADPDMVLLSGLIGDRSFAESKSILPLALGETTEGQPFVADLAGMPHLLIAGATGSGKSVCINVIITSLLYRHHPRDVRLLFVDPKMLELSMYQGIPHLERPVVTNPRAAERLLVDAVREMDDRYKTLAGAGVRSIADYNLKVEPNERLPYIVIVVDELADLMLSQSAAKIEMTITRLAQMARAVGIHLILATQRPSVDVITGLIKANFSCRIAFQVATKVDSRTILDGNGAEKLLGRGDMLFLSPGRAEPIRVHGAFISSAETTALVEFLRTQVIQPEAIQNFSETVEGEGGGEDDFGDVLFHQAADVVIRHKQGSVSLLQRRLGIGYQRAARLIDKLEEAGVVGSYDGSKAREVLWTREDLEQKMAGMTS